eukprot:TRINITY_DN8027_c0_g1_i1.p1 TRINITY_DN8027_c0_g1~~TRINITY_DN8027_c0_g1_i1.p1  ORF type:complete len:317 (+),score=96.88 TRINITY_DN8027_c0_g1_i1:357-1307(+)
MSSGRMEQELLRVSRELVAARKDLQRALRHVESLESEKLQLEEQVLAAKQGEARVESRRVMQVEHAAKAEAETLRREMGQCSRQREGLEREVAALRADLGQIEQEREMLRSRDSHRDGALSALRAQLDDAVRALSEERQRADAFACELREHDSRSQGHPVVGLELSEGAPYNIAGVWVVSVVDGGPADLCGLRPGDIISEVAGAPVPTRDDFRSVIEGGDYKSRPGQQLSFRVHREDSNGQPEQRTVMLTLGWSSRRPEGRRVITVQRSPRRSVPRDMIDESPGLGSPQRPELATSARAASRNARRESADLGLATR